ncbi:PIG-L deacetylase family protein [Sulfuricurvum sp.]|uniref:PIG-L deacetylase family protein n=1 Tax=Sulfuricurvum sp. TaxID=2025608 RepID=UPI00356485FD
MRKVLFISAHTDDIELSCPIMAKKLVDSKKFDTMHVTFSPCIVSLPNGYEPTATIKEWETAQRLVAIKTHKLYDYQVRRFNEQRQEILEDMVKLKKSYNPDIVVVHHPEDLHQDHAQLGIEAMRAFPKATIFFYEHHKWTIPEPNFYVSFDEDGLAFKIKIAKIYKSQLEKFDYIQAIKTLSSFRGMNARNLTMKYAEAFKMINGKWGDLFG